MLVSLARFEGCNSTPLLLPISLLEVQTEQILTKCHLSLVVQLYCNSMCFGSAQSRSLMIPIQLFASFDKFMRTVRKTGTWSFFRT